MLRSESVLFSPIRLGPITVPNRFIRSPTGEFGANPDGTPAKRLHDMITSYAKGECGLIIPGCMYVAESGRSHPTLTGMCTKKQSDSWKPIINEVHGYGSKIIFQIYHPGISSNPEHNGGVMPMGPSSLVSAIHEMTNQEVETMVQNFIDAGIYTYRSGADGVQLHLAHGYLLSTFLSPFYNRRSDKWGGSVENRLRIVKEILAGIKSQTPDSFHISVKLNTDDHVENGVNPRMAVQYIRSMIKDVHLFELSNGAAVGKLWAIRGKVHEKALLRGVTKAEQDALLKRAQSSFEGVPFSEQYNQQDTEYIRKAVPEAKIAMVGGIRQFDAMESIIKNNIADMVSMSRPFIRDPYIVKNLKEGKVDRSTCTNCSSCILNVTNGLYCHEKAD